MTQLKHDKNIWFLLHDRKRVIGEEIRSDASLLFSSCNIWGGIMQRLEMGDVTWEEEKVTCGKVTFEKKQ